MSDVDATQVRWYIIDTVQPAPEGGVQMVSYRVLADGAANALQNVVNNYLVQKPYFVGDKTPIVFVGVELDEGV